MHIICVGIVYLKLVYNSKVANGVYNKNACITLYKYKNI